jgi:hypothetical protein
MRIRICQAGIVLFIFTALIIGCSEENNITKTEQGAAALEEMPDSREMLNIGWEVDTCYSGDCIEDFIEDVMSYARLYVGAGSHNVYGHNLWDNVGHTNWVELIGLGTTRPTMNIMSCFSYNGGVHYGSMHFQENINLDQYTLVKDLIINNNCRMYAGYVAGIQFEACSVELDNVYFMGSGTTHFLSVTGFDVHGIQLGSNHEFVIGDEDWCGSSNTCGGPGYCNVPDGSVIEDSELDGTIRFEVMPTPTVNTLYIRDNEPLNYLNLDVDNNGSVGAIVVLEDNVFKERTGANVVIRGDYQVVASGNVTTRGRCRADALLDFDVSQATHGNPLILNSWVYNDVEYTDDPAAIVITNVTVSYDYLLCEAKIEWDTDGAPSSSVVYHGPSCSQLTGMAAGAGGVTHHTVYVDISSYYRSWAFKVKSAHECDSETGICYTKRRPTCMSQ